MKIYEIRVMSGDRSGPDIYSGSHLNDHAAVRRAMTLVKPRQWIEVWCGTRCVYAGVPGPARQTSPDCSSLAIRDLASNGARTLASLSK
jgi:hypothetical protein